MPFDKSTKKYGAPKSAKSVIILWNCVTSSILGILPRKVTSNTQSSMFILAYFSIIPDPCDVTCNSLDNSAQIYLSTYLPGRSIILMQSDSIWLRWNMLSFQWLLPKWSTHCISEFRKLLWYSLVYQKWW